MLMLILKKNMKNIKKEYLNTSYVNVNLGGVVATAGASLNLNTSYVNVNPVADLASNMGEANLNTSYVNVNPLILSHSYISIILFSSHSIKLL